MHLSHADFPSDTEVINPFPIFPKISYSITSAMGTKSNQIYPLLSPSYFFLLLPKKKKIYRQFNEALYILEWNLSSSEAEDVKFLQNFILC